MREGEKQVSGQVAVVRLAAWAVVGTLGMGALDASAATVTWDGGSTGAGNSWELPANWVGDSKPLPADTAEFGDTGIVAGKTVTLGGVNQTVTGLTYNTATNFTIGNANTLTLTNVTRNDVAGTEGIPTLSAAVALAGNSQWNINGDAYLNATGVISGAGYVLTKTGAGELRLAGNNNYDGGTTVSAGTLRVTSINGNVLRGAVTVGGGSGPAELILAPSAGTPSQLSNTGTINVNNTGTMTLSTVSGGYYLETLNVAGGTLDLGGGTVNLSNNVNSAKSQSFTMTGGTVRNGVLNISGGISLDTLFSTTASATTATMTSGMSIGGYQVQLDIADGAAAIDFDLQGNLSGGINFRKLGTGVMALSSPTGNTVLRAGDSVVAAGTLLANNVSGSAFGNTRAIVAGGGTLGGSGKIGGVLSNGTNGTNANVTLTGTAADNRAVLSPGSVDTNAVSIIGTLTVGDATQNNNVTFNAFSTLASQVGNAGNADLLQIVGALSLSTTSDLLAISTLAGSTPSGTYTLATFTGLLTGRFNEVTFDGLPLPTGYDVRYLDALGNTVVGTGNYTGGSIVLDVPIVAVPEPGTAGLALGLTAVGLLRRRQRRTV